MRHVALNLRFSSYHRRLLIGALLLSCLFIISTQGLAAEGQGAATNTTPSPPPSPKNDKVYQPEEEDFSNTPFTEYGEFNEDADEEADIKFFQHGRFFGVGLGLGYEGVTGNRGLLWQGGFPMFDLKVHYWFDFNVALQLGFFTVSHFYESKAKGHVDVNMIHLGLDVKYYFETKNLSSAISFANPYILLGIGGFTKSEVNATDQTVDSDNSFGLSLGGGFEFAITPRKIYLTFEPKYHIVNFKDKFTTIFRGEGKQNLDGGFYTLTMSVNFTW